MNGRTFGELLASEHKDHFYMMHLSYGSDKTQRKRLWKYAIANNTIGLDWHTIKRKWEAPLSKEELENTSQFWIRQFKRFCEEMHVGDYVVILNGTYSVLGIAKITEPNYEYDSNISSYNEANPARFFDHFRDKIEWVKQFLWDGCVLSEQLTFDGTLDRVTPRTHSHRWRILTMIDP